MLGENAVDFSVCNKNGLFTAVELLVRITVGWGQYMRKLI